MKKKIILAIICVLSFALFSGISVTNNTVKADVKFPVSELFLSPYSKIQSGVSPKESNILQTATYIETDRKDSNVSLKNEFVGEFSMLLEPVLSKGASTLRSMSFTFTDQTTDNTFDLYVEFEQNANLSIIVDGEQAGIAYYNGTTLSMSGIANTAGIYTNYSSMLLPITFSPTTMCVYVGEGTDKKLIWNLSQKINDNKEFSKTLDPFTKYSVGITLHDFIGGSSGIYIYSINGYQLNKNVITKSEAGNPCVVTKIKAKGVIGKTYYLPDAYAYDLIDGEISTYEKIIKAPNGDELIVDGHSFQPNQSGKYILKYLVENSFGKKAIYEYEIEILANAPGYTYQYVDKTPEFPNTVNVGDSIYIPQMTVDNGLSIDDPDIVNVTIKRNSISQIDAINRLSGFYYTFRNHGRFEISYNLPDENIAFVINVLKNEINTSLSTEIKKEYALNTYINLTDERLIVDSENVDFDLIVEFPSGKCYSSKKFVCSEAGVYTLTAKSKNNSACQAVYTFSVDNQVKNLFGGNSDISSEFGKSSVTQKNGVIVYTQSSGSPIKYLNTIDLSKYINQAAPATGTEINSKYAVNAFEKKYGDNYVGISSTATPIIDFSVEPYAYNKNAISGLNIVLTDVKDSNNKLTINVVNFSNNKTQAYIRASAGEQNSAGLHPGANNKDNCLYIDNWGHIIQHTFFGSFGSSSGFDMTKSRIQLFYDYQEKRLLVGERGSNAMCLIVDFDDSRLCGGEPWNGFSTGEVELSIELVGLIYEKAGIVVYSIDGTDLSADAVKYSEPKLYIGDKYTEGVKGKSFKIPKVTAYDSNGTQIRKINTQVVYIINNREYDVSVKDGIFITDRTGIYCIRYFATDIYGNQATEEFMVQVYNDYPNFEVSANITSEYLSGKTGMEIALFPINEIVKTNDLNGVSAEISVESDNENIPVKNNFFYPKKPGIYHIKYILTDGIGRSATLEYDVNITVETELIISSAIPTYVGFIEGNNYELADIYVIDYANGFTDPIRADIYIDGEKIFNNNYCPTVSEIEAENEEERIRYVTLEYKYGDTVLQSYILPVRNVYKECKVYIGSTVFSSKKFVIDRYFYSKEGVNITLGNTLSLEFTKSNAITSFIQPLNAKNLNFVFDITGKKENFEAIDTNISELFVYITDANDIDKQIELKFILVDGKTNLFVNGELVSGNLSGSLDGTTKDKFDIKFNSNSNSLINTKTSEVLIAIKKYLNGKNFEGFSGNVYLSYKAGLKDASKSANIEIYSINGQNFNDGFEDDTIAPVIKVRGEITMSSPVGSNLIIPAATASDVLSDVSEVTLSVKLNGLAVKDISGKTLENVPADVEYKIVLNSVGSYVISYNSKDSRGAISVAKDYVVRSVLNQKPLITVSGELPKKVKVGTTIELPTFTVTYLEENKDNLSYGICITPTNRYEYLNSNKFIPDKVGYYKIKFFALDAYGNYSLYEHVFEATD